MSTATQVLQVIEKREGVDNIADKVQKPIHDLLENRPGLRAALQGDWLGHPLHAAITDFPVGAWATGFVLDMVALGGHRKPVERAAFAAHAFGLAAASVAAVAGLADWSYLKGKPRRVGAVHSLLNTTAAVLFGASLLLRRSGRKSAGIAASTIGLGVVMASAWLGGEMSYHYGVRVDKQAPELKGLEAANVGA